jgi:cobalt/nickel transport system permease protein
MPSQLRLLSGQSSVVVSKHSSREAIDILRRILYQLRVTKFTFVSLVCRQADGIGKGTASMHMADALISPAVAGVMWAVSAGAVGCCSLKLGRDGDDRKAPLMGVLGAFLFAAQMINFSIPATGSSGHLVGGLLLAILLGPCAAFITIASVLVVQALFFADGGLLALGCNIFNMGFVPAFLVFPFFYRKLIGTAPTGLRMSAVTVTSALIALQLGALAVVFETVCSGVSVLPFFAFALLMQPIHLAIGVVEGVVTVAILSFLRKARPEIVPWPIAGGAMAGRPGSKVLSVVLVCSLITAGVLSVFASKNPDGLQWSIARITGETELKAPGVGVHAALAEMQKRSAWFSGYAVGKSAAIGAGAGAGAGREKRMEAGTGVAGMVGTILTLLFAFFAGVLLKKKKRGAC